MRVRRTEDEPIFTCAAGLFCNQGHRDAAARCTLCPGPGADTANACFPGVTHLSPDPSGTCQCEPDVTVVAAGGLCAAPA
jgi:hypothetical protein